MINNLDTTKNLEHGPEAPVQEASSDFLEKTRQVAFKESSPGYTEDERKSMTR